MSRAVAAYYNEIDPYAAAWLRNLISEGLIAPGEVDERSIADVAPTELSGFTQCHFFAGIGVWSAALRGAGWPDDRPVWTGSCPCQPFSAAGRGDGFADERHLWPSWYHIIGQCRPPVAFGEQVASKDADVWVDLVQDDLEALGYAFGAVPFPAASQTVDYAETRFGAETLEWIRRTVGACPDPELTLLLRDFAAQDRGSFGVGSANLRDRLFWVADADLHGCDQGRAGDGAQERDGPFGDGSADRLADACRQGPSELVGRRVEPSRPSPNGAIGVLADTCGTGSSLRELDELRGARGRAEGRATEQRGGASGGLADAVGDDAAEVRAGNDAVDEQRPAVGRRAVVATGAGADGRTGAWDHRAGRGDVGHSNGPELERPGSSHGFRRDVDWLICRDGRGRPVEPGTSPLAHGSPARVGRLRSYGNAINFEAAVDFIRSYLEA